MGWQITREGCAPSLAFPWGSTERGQLQLAGFGVALTYSSFIPTNNHRGAVEELGAVPCLSTRSVAAGAKRCETGSKHRFPLQKLWLLCSIPVLPNLLVSNHFFPRCRSDKSTPISGSCGDSASPGRALVIRSPRRSRGHLGTMLKVFPAAVWL